MVTRGETQFLANNRMVEELERFNTLIAIDINCHRSLLYKWARTSVWTNRTLRDFGERGDVGTLKISVTLLVTSPLSMFLVRLEVQGIVKTHGNSGPSNVCISDYAFMVSVSLELWSALWGCLPVWPQTGVLKFVWFQFCVFH